MPFIGNQPALSYTSFAKQDFTTSATTTYTLDQPVANANELALFINFVRQEPTTAYTASGTTLTLTSATSASDDMYCVFLGKAVQTVNPPNGSVGLSQLSATGTPSSSTFLRGDNSWQSAGGTNTPAFFAYLNADQTGIGDATSAKIQVNTEIYDTNNCYDNSTNYRFTPTVAGKYLFHAQTTISAEADSNGILFDLYVQKNGSITSQSTTNASTNYLRETTQNLNVIFDANGSTDYFEMYAYCNTNNSGTWSAKGFSGRYRTYFGAFKIIE